MRKSVWRVTYYNGDTHAIGGYRFEWTARRAALKYRPYRIIKSIERLV